MGQELVTISKQRFEQMEQEIKILRNSKWYKRLLEFEKNLSEGKRFTRQNLGF